MPFIVTSLSVILFSGDVFQPNAFQRDALKRDAFQRDAFKRDAYQRDDFKPEAFNVVLYLQIPILTPKKHFFETQRFTLSDYQGNEF